MVMNPSWPELSCGLFYDDPAAAIDWLCRAFGFEVRIKITGENGEIHHSELVLGKALIMVGSSKKDPLRKSPRSIGGVNTQGIMLMVDDADAHCRKAREAGAKIISEPKTVDYGAEYWADRNYECEDPEGHRWWIAQRIRNQK